MKVADCATQLEELAGAVKGIDKRVMILQRQQDIETMLGGSLMKRPCVGVLYEGGRSSGAVAGAGAQVGGSGELVFSLLLMTEVPALAPNTKMLPIVQGYLDDLRAAVQGKKSSTGHLWKWVLEAPAAEKGNLLLWVQRWSTPVQSVSRSQ